MHLYFYSRCNGNDMGKIYVEIKGGGSGDPLAPSWGRPRLKVLMYVLVQQKNQTTWMNWSMSHIAVRLASLVEAIGYSQSVNVAVGIVVRFCHYFQLGAFAIVFVGLKRRCIVADVFRGLFVSYQRTALSFCP